MKVFHCGDLISLGFDAAARGLAIVKITVHSGNSGSSTTTRVGGRITGAANVYVLFRIDDRY